MEFTVSTSKSQQLVDITHKVEEAVKKSGLKDGLCNVYVPHATAAIAINENADPNITLDIVDALNEMVREGGWRHDRIDNNAAAHIKAAIIGPSETIPVKDGELQLGTWQDVFLCCFDGPRKRRIIVTVIKG
ncbi:secondary thiamine-phosphate synthase enzyme YjbQ [Candidatus Woesearchaeota archaeon]|jgi:secondary thiamine-phosphate synthase enzyme|nr:secondary thiamine-phosphate synthase enzyme YjbQ [Candidatus Woesearchaeota archaeon]